MVTPELPSSPPGRHAGGILLLILLAAAPAGCALAPQAAPDNGPASLPSFPWPPPAASAHDDLTVALTRAPASTLGEWDARLAAALAQAGYSERVYHHVPEGFALVTRLEQIDGDGRPRGEQRWSKDQPRPEFFSLGSYLRSVFLPTVGRYRVLVFVVSSAPFALTARGPSREKADDWGRSGMLGLPASIAGQALAPGHRCAALVYEFERPDAEQDPRFVEASLLSGHQHLVGSGLWQRISGS